MERHSDTLRTDGAFLEEYRNCSTEYTMNFRISTDYMVNQKNVTMKAKVFKYKSDGNTVAAVWNWV